MPKINPNALEQDKAPVADLVEFQFTNIGLSIDPVFIVGVNRKVNIGNFENIDVYSGLSIPLPGGSIENKEALADMVAHAAEVGFNLVSQETGARYAAIKELQKNARK